MDMKGKSYEEHVTCPVCMDLLSNPRALPCMHTFCSNCLTSYITSVCKTGDEKGFKCPVCKSFTKPPFKGTHPHSWADNFPLNFALKGLADEMKSTKQRDKDVKNKAASDKKTERCTSHIDRPIEFECIDHCEKFCSVCAALFHRKCEQVNFLGLKESKIMKTSLKGQTVDEDSFGRTKKHKAVTRLSKAASFDDKEETLPKAIDSQALAQDFEHARTICDANSKNKSEFLSSVNEHQEKCLNKKLARSGRRRSVEEIHEKPIENTRKALTRLWSNTSNVEDSNITTDLSKPINTSIPGHQKHSFMESINSTCTAREFDPHYLTLSSLNDILEEDEDIVSVTIDQNASKSQAYLVNEFYIRSQYDRRCCSVTGICAFPDGRVLLADESNENVKLFDTNGIYEAHLDLDSKPWDVAAVEECEAVVSCPETKCIQIILVNNILTITRTLSLDKNCYGISYCKGELYIALGNEVRILTYDGKAVRKISSESTRKRLFSLPFSLPKSLFRCAKYISVKSDGVSAIIVVSDSFKVCVTSMTKRGEIISRFRLADDGLPYGVTVGTGDEFYVCQAPNKLVAINSGEFGNVIKPVAELDAIQAVHFHKKSRSLWVTRKAHNFVMVYSVRNNQTGQSCT